MRTGRAAVATEFARREAIGLPEAEGRAAKRPQEAERDPTGLLPKYHSSVLNSLVITILADTLVWY